MPIFRTLFIQLSELGNFWQKRTSRRLFLISVFSILSQIAFIIFYSNQLPPQLPLFYSLPWGQAQLASPSSLYLLPLSSLIFLFSDIFLILFLAKQKLLAMVLLISAFSYCLLSNYALFKIISLVT